MKYLVWTLLMWIPLIALAAGTSQLGRGAIFVLALLLGLPIYLIGLVVMWWRDMGRWSR